jgi:hypothetical protein
MSAAVEPSFPVAELSALRAAEARLLARRARPADPEGSVAEALRAASGDAVPAPIQAAGQRIAAAVARHGAAFRAGEEPGYHDRHHQAEATLAVGWLAREARLAGLLDAEAAALCVLAMAGHDLLHDGQAHGRPGALEARSAAATLAICTGLPLGAQAEIQRLILLTDLCQPPPADLPGRIAREADLFGSLTPTLGWRLSRAMAGECRHFGQPGADTIATFRGRLVLLRAQPAPTPAARALGVPAAVALQVAAMQAAVADATSPEAGAAQLDALPEAEAHRRYAATMAALGLPSLPP